MPSHSSIEFFSVYSSPAKPAARSSSPAASPFDEKENLAPAGTPPAQRWYETTDSYHRSPEDPAVVQRLSKPAGGKHAPSDKAARKPLRNITPLLVRKVCKPRPSFHTVFITSHCVSEALSGCRIGSTHWSAVTDMCVATASIGDQAPAMPWTQCVTAPLLFGVIHALFGDVSLPDGI